MIRSLAGAIGLVLFFALAPVAAQDLAVNPLVIERDVTVGGMLSDRFTWRDASNQPRVGALAHNDGQTGPGGTRGGELRELRYETPGGSRVVRASGSAASGFGYIVAHRSEGTDGLGGADDSPLGHFFPGSFERVFEGRHHAIFRFTQLYPRHSRQSAVPPNTTYDVPVTTDWVVATGRDHPLWAVTWDLSGVPVGAVESDSRAPYGELLFDGAASEEAHSVVAGVGWGDRFKFASTTSPVTYNSAWTWDVPNTVPYVKLWTTDVDATMGTVQTQTIDQQDAGGYFGTGRWGTTSAAGNACTVAIGGVDHLMPCDFNWPYQSINFSLNPFTPAEPTNNTRLAWGTNFGFLGQAQYLTHGSAFFGGPRPDTFAPGWPKKSYSAFVVLGLHSANPVGAQVAQIEAAQTTTLTTTVGSVVTTGPAGVNRADTVAYAPAGWNHVYAAWALRAAANRVDVNFNAGGGVLAKPLVIVSNWTTGALPVTVRLNGVTLALDVDYFPSPRTDAQELWITVNRPLAGATNRLEILAAPPPVEVVTVLSPGSATVGGVGFTLAVTGSNFTPGSVVRWNGSPRPTTFVSAGLLTADISAADVAAPGSIQVSVFNPASGGGGSNVVTLTLVTQNRSGLAFYPLARPVRLLDTRPGEQGCDAPGSAIPAGTARALFARRTCDGIVIPAGAIAVTGNITTVESGGGHLTLYASDTTRPQVANSNYQPNEVLNNVFTVGLGADGAFQIFVINTTDVVVDVTGYYAQPGAGGLFFHPLPRPVRLLDTRPGEQGCTAPGVKLPGGVDTTQGAHTVCAGVTIPASARAIVGNATTVDPGAAGHLTLFPAGAPRPLVASSNYDPGEVMNAPFTVGLAPTGEFKIFTLAPTHLVIDVLGYYSAEALDVNGAGLLFTPLPAPVRLLDTRADPGFLGCFKPNAPIAGGVERTQPARAQCGIAATARAIVGNATVVNANGGHLTFWPSDVPRPQVATSNFLAGQVFNRHFTVGVGAAVGDFKIFAVFTTDLVIDVSGFFAP
jgi:hypothetical protein